MLKIHVIVYILVCVVVFPNTGQSAVENGANDANVLFDTHQAILDEGYPAETHRVITHDGYILEVTRIPHGRNQTKDNVSRPVVFMMHGLLSAAHSFIILGSQYSIAYHLADAGFDIWMGNARGNHYSRSHVTLDPDHPEERFKFFDFSFEEIGMYDLASMIDYILDQTNQDTLHYIGHSQGGTAFLVLTTMRPEYNSKIKGAHLLAAVGYQEYFPNTQLTSLAERVDIIYSMALLLGIVEYFPLDLLGEGFPSRDPDYCFGDMKYKHICYLVGAREIMSEDSDTISMSAGASLKQVAHFGQNIRDRIFRRWHYGADQNIEVYGTSDPPIYDLSLISTYVTMHYSLNDNLLDERDVLAMADDISKCRVHRVSRESFLHEDYVASADARELVTNYIIEDILNLEAGNYSAWEKSAGTDNNETDENNIDESDDKDTVDGTEPNSSSAISNSIITIIFVMFCMFLNNVVRSK